MDERPRHPDLDEAIDRGVRGMMDVDPVPGFERRVMRRLEQPRRHAFSWPQFAVAGAALATILIVAVVLRDAPERQGSQDPTNSTTTARTPPAPQPSTGSAVTPPNVPPVPTSIAPAPSTDRVATMRPMAPAPRDVMAASVEEESTDSPIATIAALDPPSALAIASIEQQPVNVPAIMLSRIEIGELNVQRLPAPDEGGKE